MVSIETKVRRHQSGVGPMDAIVVIEQHKCCVCGARQDTWPGRVSVSMKAEG